MIFLEYNYFVTSLLQEDLFQQPGLRLEFERIRDCLDTGMIDTLETLCILQIVFVCVYVGMRKRGREREKDGEIMSKRSERSERIIF